MRLKRKLNNLTAAALLCMLFALVGSFYVGPARQALAAGSGPNGQCLPRDVNCTPPGANAPSNSNFGNECNSTITNSNLQNCVHNNKLVTRLREIINFLAAGVGVVVVFALIIAGIQYTTAGDNPAKVQDARKRILNAIIALIAFGLTFAFLQYLIPGGLFNP